MHLYILCDSLGAGILQVSAPCERLALLGAMPNLASAESKKMQLQHDVVS